MERSEYPHTLTPRQLKEFLNVGLNQTYDIIRRPDFPKFYVGRSPRIPRDAFFEWYDTHCGTGERLQMNS